MPPQFNTTSVPLFKSTGIPAMNALCCCDVPPTCFCTEFIFRPPCGCVEEDFGTDKVLGDAVFSITGSLISLPFRGTNFSPFPFVVCNGPDCVDISGSYVVPCSTTACYNVLQYVCTVERAFSTPLDIYYQTKVTFLYRLFNNAIVLECSMISTFHGAPVGSSNPAPTFATPCQPVSITWLSSNLQSRRSGRNWQASVPRTLYDAYVFQLGGDCTTDCNPLTAVRSCIAGSQSMTADVIQDGTGDSCAFSGLSISVSVNTPA